MISDSSGCWEKAVTGRYERGAKTVLGRRKVKSLLFFPIFKVLLAQHKSTRKHVAIKAMTKVGLIDGNGGVDVLYSEKNMFEVASKDRHPFLVNLHACFQTDVRTHDLYHRELTFYTYHLCF